MTTMRVVGECFFWYRLTRVFPDKFHRAIKRLCVWDISQNKTPRQLLAANNTLNLSHTIIRYASGLSQTVHVSAERHAAALITATAAASRCLSNNTVCNLRMLVGNIQKERKMVTDQNGLLPKWLQQS